jgi:hypothetical protein
VFSGKNREEIRDIQQMWCCEYYFLTMYVLIRPDANDLGVFLGVFCAFLEDW